MSTLPNITQNCAQILAQNILAVWLQVVALQKANLTLICKSWPQSSNNFSQQKDNLFFLKIAMNDEIHSRLCGYGIINRNFQS